MHTEKQLKCSFYHTFCSHRVRVSQGHMHLEFAVGSYIFQTRGPKQYVKWPEILILTTIFCQKNFSAPSLKSEGQTLPELCVYSTWVPCWPPPCWSGRTCVHRACLVCPQSYSLHTLAAMWWGGHWNTQTSHIYSKHTLTAEEPTL